MKALLISCCLLVFVGAISAQRPFREYPSVEYGESTPLPPDWQRPGEWAFARLMYPPGPNDGYRGRFDGDWRQGMSLWTQDGPPADRFFAAAVRRLTRIDARSVEQDVNLDDGDEVYNWPWLYGVEVGHWDLTNAQAAKLRDFLLRGGFFMCDDFHGTDEWNIFIAGMNRVFPDRPIVDIDNADAIFHTIFDLNDRYQVPGEQFVYSHRRYEKDGFDAHWRGIYDDNGRVMVAMAFNSDIGDSWEWADDPNYPEKFSALGIRIGVNYVIYSMTH